MQQLSEALAHYMQQSEQLQTTFVLAANAQVAAGLLVQRMPLAGEGNLGEGGDADALEDYQRIAHLAASLTREELLGLDVDQILHRLFWDERLMRFAPRRGADGPRFACTCGRERVAQMLRGLGAQEVQSVVDERGGVDVSCEFCGQPYHFDAVDAIQLFTEPGQQPPVSSSVQ